MASGLTDKQILGFSRWFAFVGAFLAMLVISPYQYAFSAFSHDVTQYFHISAVFLGTVFTVTIFLESVFGWPTGFIRDRFGPWLLQLIAAFLVGIGYFAAIFGSPGLLLWVYAVIGGIGAGIVYNNSVTVANKWFPDYRATTAGLISAGYSWGSIPIILLIGILPRVNPIAVFRSVMIGLAVVSFVVILISAFLMRRDPPPGWRPPGFNPQRVRSKTVRAVDYQFTFSETVRTWQFWVLVISFLLVASEGLTIVSKAVQYGLYFKFPLVVAVAASLGSSIFAGLGKFIAGVVSDRIGVIKTLILFYALSGVFTLLSILFGFIRNEAGFVASVALAILFWASIYTVNPAAVGYFYGEVAAGNNYGLLYALAKGSGAIYGGVLTALMIGSLGWINTMIISGLFGIIAAILGVPLLWKVPKPPRSR
ncbi:MFS transporter [Vulcanisaeta thermophila]|uniref:MFS transporter n=1 Tax=Vulcanisaeta thermophila TaxID=867917 RepID=UPI000852BDFD|nr:MFS transporter [Vulcanisaeta thermophila]